MSIAKLSKPARLFVKNEATYNVAETLVASDVVPTSNLQLGSGTGATELSRDLDTGGLGATPVINVGPNNSLSFDFEMTAPGTGSTTVPAWAKLMRMAGHSVAVGGSNVIIQPIDAGFESATLQAYFDGLMFKSTGAMITSLSLSADSVSIPKFSATTTGIWNTPVDAPILAQDASAWQAPQGISNALTPTFKFDGLDLVMQNFSVNWGLSGKYYNFVNGECVAITGRSIEVTATVQAGTVAEKNWLQDSLNGAEGVFQMIHGVGAPGTVEINCPNASLKTASLNRGSEIMMFDLSWSCLPTTDEFQIITVGA